MILFIITVAYLIVLTFYFIKLRNHYHRLISVSGKENLTEILDTILDKLGSDKKDIAGLKENLKALNLQGRSHIQKVGVMKFNPFSDTGGDQSFILSILDSDESGVLLTSLHSRNVTRWYAKNIKNGKGTEFDLTDEEKKAIKSARYIIKS